MLNKAVERMAVCIDKAQSYDPEDGATESTVEFCQDGVEMRLDVPADVYDQIEIGGNYVVSVCRAVSNVD